MNDQAPEANQSAPAEHDNTWLKVYLQAIRDAGINGMTSEQCDEVFPTLLGEDEEAKATPSKIRQTMYIAKLAKKGAGGALFLTQRGEELIGAGNDPVTADQESDDRIG